MAEMLFNTVVAKTALQQGFIEHAAHQAMSVYLADWENAYDRLGLQIEKLRRHRDARIEQVNNGEWPSPIQEPAESKVVDLMDQLERSVQAAREARDAQR